MNTFKNLATLFITSYLFSSCAASYKSISPNTLQYSQTTENGNFSYKYDVLRFSNNRKLAKKEFNTGIKIVAVKIVNTTGQSLKYGVNYKIYAGDREVDILPIPEVTRNIKETVPTYLLYLLLTPTTLNTSSETSSSSLPIGLILGPGLALLNVGIAATANKHFRMEMEEYNLIGKEIKSGETVYGLIGLQSQDFATLSLRVMGN